MKQVTIVGVGALGSHVVQFLRNEDIGLTVVDFDRVEMKNTRSQFHPAGQVGKNKGASLSKTMAFLFKTKFRTIPHRLTNDNVEELLGGSDLVVDCLDNAASRRLVQNFCLENKVSCLHGALDAAGSFGRVLWTEQFTVDEEVQEGATTCEDGAFLPFIGVVAAYIARATQLYIREDKKTGFIISPTNVFSA